MNGLVVIGILAFCTVAWILAWRDGYEHGVEVGRAREAARRREYPDLRSIKN